MDRVSVVVVRVAPLSKVGSVALESSFWLSLAAAAESLVAEQYIDHSRREPMGLVLGPRNLASTANANSTPCRLGPQPRRRRPWRRVPCSAAAVTLRTDIVNCSKVQHHPAVPILQQAIKTFVR
jgi:hypothetical protein